MANVFSTATLGLRLDTSIFNNAIKASGLTVQHAFASMSAGADQFKMKWDDATAGIKDTRRIISGILISQGFYGIMNALGEGASAALTFSSNMETAAISTEYFVHGADKAAQSLAYLREMSEFAARTPFSTEAANELSKYIQSVGIGMNVSKSVLQVITDAAAATGATEETMQRIVFALGQMKTKGRIAGEEIRQLANANVPIYEILQEELGLTGDEIANIGKKWISADKAIVAILDGLEKRYSGAADRIAETMSGMVDTIADDALIIAYQAGDGIYDTFEDIVRSVRDKLDEYRDIATEFGAMGLFNNILLEIDPTGQFGTQLLTLVGDARQLIAALSDLMHTSQPLINLFGNGLYGAIGTVTVGATSLVKMVDNLERLLSKLGITSGQTGRLLGELFVMYQAGKWAFTLGQGALYAGQSLLQVGKTTLTSLVPSMMVGSQSVLGLVGSLLALASAGVAVYSILNSLGGFGGLDIDAGSILPSDYQSEFDRYMAEMEEYNEEIAKYQEQFNEPYSAIGEGTDKAIESYDELKKASKSAAKSVQHDWVAAFDEVYQVPTFNDPSNSSDTPELPELPDLGKLINEIKFSFPGIPSDELEKPDFNWDEVFDNSFFDSDVFSGGWWKSMLPAAIVAGLAGWFTPKGPKGPGDVPTGGSGKYVVNDANIKKAVLEFSDEMKKLNAALGDAKRLLANGDVALPGTTPAYGVDGKTLLALADRLEASNLALDEATQKAIEAGADPRQLPEYLDTQKYLTETEAIKKQLTDNGREITGIRKELANREARREAIPVDLQRRLENAEIDKHNLEKRLAMRAETPEGTLAAQRQQAKIQADQLRALGYEQRIKELERTLENIGDLSLGQRELVIKELGENKKALEVLIKNNSGINPKYNSLNPVQFVDEFGRMGEQLAETFETFAKRRYAPGVVNSAETFNKEAILALKSQVEQFKLVGNYIQENFHHYLITAEEGLGTAKRIYLELMSQDNNITKMFNQIVRGSNGSNTEASPITVLKDLAKNVASLTDAAIADEKLLAAQLEEAAQARQAAATAREAARLEEQKRLVALRQAQANEEFNVNGRALDASTQATATEYIQDAIKASAEDVANQLREPLQELLSTFELANGNGIKSESVLVPGRSGAPDIVVKELIQPINNGLSEIADILLEHSPDEVYFPDDVKEMFTEIIGKIDGDSNGYAKLLAEYINTPIKPTTANIAALDIQDILHKAVRDTLGYAAPELLGRTPELMWLRNQVPGGTIGIGDIAGMLQGSSAFGSAAEVAGRISKALSGLDASKALRDANFTTTVAGELTRQISDLIRYSAAASLPAAGLTVYSGGLVESAGASLQVDAIAEGVIKGTSRSVPIQLISVSDRVASQIAMLASTPVGGLAELDATKLAATNSEAFYELGTLIKALGTTDQNKGLKTGIIAIINRDLNIFGTRFADKFIRRLGITPGSIQQQSLKPLSTDSIMTWRRTRGLEDLSPKELVSDYVKRVLLPTFGFFPDVIDGNLTGTEAERLNEIFKDVNKTARQFNGSLDALKDNTQYYLVEFTSRQLDAMDLKDAVAGTNKHVQLIQEAFSTLGDTDELKRLMHSYVIMNANAGELANAVFEVDFGAPIRQYTQLHQNANKWASDLLKADVKFSYSGAVTSEFVAAVDGVMMQYFNELDTALADEMGTIVASTKAQLREIANNAFGYLDLGSDVELAKRALNVLADNLDHIDPLSMTIRSYVDVLADFNRALAADLPIDKHLAAQFDGLTRNASKLIDRFGLDSNVWIQGYVRNLSNLNERLRAVADALEVDEYGANLSTIFDGPIEALMRVANSSETADLATNWYRSLIDGALNEAISNTVANALQGVVPTPVHQASQAVKPFGNATIIDLETFGLPQATKNGTIYPEIFSGAMYNPSTGEMDRFYNLPDDILALIRQQGADSAAARSAVENYIANIRAINADFRDIYGQPEITEDVIAKGISRADAVKKLTEWTTSNPNGFTGYNATNLGRVGGAFDANTIRAFTGIDVSNYAADDVMSLVTRTLRRYTGTDTTLKLTELRDMFGISDEMLQAVYGISESASHTAQADVLVTNEVLKRVLGGSLDSIAAAGLRSGWRYIDDDGKTIKSIEKTLISLGKAGVGNSDAYLSAADLQRIYIQQARVAGASEEAISNLNATYTKFIEDTLATGKAPDNMWKAFQQSNAWTDIADEARRAAEALADTTREAGRAVETISDVGNSAAEAASTLRRTTTAADLGDVAGAVGTARQAAVEDIGGPNAWNWLRSKFSDLWDKITGHKTLDDYFDATKAAGDTYESRIFNEHLFGGRRKSAPTFDDLRAAFEELRHADTSQMFNGMLMESLRNRKNAADMAVESGTASNNTEWVRQARAAYESALQGSYGNISDTFYKTLINHVAGQLNDNKLYSSFSELITTMKDDTSIFAVKLGEKFGIIGDVGEKLEITAKSLKVEAFTDALKALNKAGSFGDAFKSADNFKQIAVLLNDFLSTVNPTEIVLVESSLRELAGSTEAFDTLMTVFRDIKGLRNNARTLDELASVTRTFIDNINSYGSSVAVMRSTVAGLDDAADDLLFVGHRAASAVNQAADTVSNSFKNLFSRAVDGVANFGLIDIAIASVVAVIQHQVDEANKASLQTSMAVRDETGSVRKLEEAGFNIGEVIGNDIYHGAAQEFGNAIASGVVSSLGATAGFALGGKVGGIIGAAIGTAAGGPIGTVIGKLVGTGIGIATGAVTGALADSYIDSIGGHSTTNLYLDDYLTALRRGSLITADALDDMCVAVGVTAEEITELGQAAALAKHGVDVGALEELARNINTNVTMGSANYDQFMQRDDINRVLIGTNSHADYKPEQVAARIAAAYGTFDSSIFRNMRISTTGESSGMLDHTVLSDGLDPRSEEVIKALQELTKYTGMEFEFRTVNLPGDAATGTPGSVVYALYEKDSGEYSLPINFNFSDLESIPEAMRLAYTQGNTDSDIAKILSDVIESNNELNTLVADNISGRYSTMAAYNNLQGYLGLFNKLAGSEWTLHDLSTNYDLGMRVQEWAAQYNELGVDELLRRLEQSVNDVSIYNARPDYDIVTYRERPFGYTPRFEPVANSVFNEGKQTLWGTDLSSLLPEYIDELSKYGFTLEAGSVIGQTELSDPQAYNFATLTTDPTIIKEALTGWRIDMSNLDLNGLDFSNLSITAKDAEIMANAGIQINSDGTVTFMKAEQASVTGAERSSADLDPSIFSQYVLDTLKGASLEINFETGELKFDPKEIGSNIYGAMFKLPDDWKKIAEPEIQEALSQLGDIMDSGYIMITDESVLNGRQTIEGFVSGLVGNNKINKQVSAALGGIDALIHKEGQSVVDNITEWASAITIQSPFKPKELNEEMKAMFETMGIHFVEYGDEFLMQINQTGEHIKDGCVMLDADYWNELPASLRGALEEMGVESTEVGNQVMVDLSATMEAGIGNLVSLYTERPDIWDQLPESIKTALQACIVETDNGMLELINNSESRLLQVGDTWITSWEAIGSSVNATLDELGITVENGVAEIVRPISEADISTLLDDEIAIPFSDLPADIQQALTGQAGWSETMRDGLVVVKNVAHDQLSEIVATAQTSAGDIGDAAADIVTQIKQAVTEANMQLNYLQQLQGKAGKTGGLPFSLFGIGATDNTQGELKSGYIDGKAVYYVAEYDSKGTLLFYRYIEPETGTSDTTTTKPSDSPRPGGGRGSYNRRASGGPASGLTLTGELGTEMAILPDGSIQMLGANGRGELVDLPAGTRVLNAEDTEEILKYTGPISNVSKFAEGNTDLVVQQPEEDQTFKAIMVAFMKAMIGQQTTNDAETDLAVTTDPMITVVDDAAKRLVENNSAAIQSATGTIQETLTLYNNQQLTTVDNGFNNVIAAISAKDVAWTNTFRTFETNLKQLLSANSSAVISTVSSGFGQVQTALSSAAQAIESAIKDARDEIVKAIKSSGISSTSSIGTSSAGASASSTAGSAANASGADTGTGTNNWTIDPTETQFIFDGVNVYEIPSYKSSHYVSDAGGNVDWAATAVELASVGDWVGAMDALSKRMQKVSLLGTDYGTSNIDVYNKALEAYNNSTISTDYLENVRGYLSVGSIQSALNEFDKRGYKISVTGDDGGYDQQTLWNEALFGRTGISYAQWLSMHDSTGYNALPYYDDDAVLDMFDFDAPVITDAMDKNLKETARAILDGEDVNLENFKDFCDLIMRTGYAKVDKGMLEAIEAGHEDTVSIVDALELIEDAFKNFIEGPNGVLQYISDVGIQGVYDYNDWNYRTNEDGMYNGPTGNLSFTSIDLATDYGAMMANYAAAGDWDAFDTAAQQRNFKILATGSNGKYKTTEDIARELEEQYKRNGSARGSLISEEGLYYAGEEGKQEAIIPLEQPEVLDKLGNAIGPYVDGNNTFDYGDNIDDASIFIKEGNEVAIHGAVAALLEGWKTDHDDLFELLTTHKDEIIAAINNVSSSVTNSMSGLAASMSSAAGNNTAASNANTSNTASTGGYRTERPTSYTPNVTNPGSQIIIYDSNVDYSTRMAEYAEAGNWSAFDTAAAQRDAKMAADPSLSKWATTDTLREQLEDLYKRHGSAEGSIISREGLYYAGEEDKQEAIIPLEQPEALDKVGAAISEYVNPSTYDYSADIGNAAIVIKEGNDVVIHGAVAALLEGWQTDHDALLELLTTHKDEIIAAIAGVGTTLSTSMEGALSKLAFSAVNTGSASSSGTTSSTASTGGYRTERPTSYTPMVTNPGSQIVIYDSNVDYHARMAEYAAAGNWSAFDTAAAQRDAKMAADPSLNSFSSTDTLREQLEKLYKRHGSAKGSVIGEEGLYYAGEKNKQEAIIPLEDPQVLSSVGQAIGEYTDPQTTYVDYTGSIADAAVVIKEGNEVAIHGAVAALLEGWKTDNDALFELLTTHKDEIIAAINEVSTTLNGSLSNLANSMKSAGGGNTAAAAASSATNSTASAGGYCTKRPTSYTPNITNPGSQVVIYDSNVDYHARMAEYAAAGNWSAFDTAAAQRDAKMAADPSLSVWRETDDLRQQLEEQYKRNGSAMGSLISAPGLYYAGEMGLDEAIVPLEQPQVLRKVGASIASFMPVDMQQQMSMAQGLTNAGIGTTATYAPQPATDPSLTTASVIQSVLESVLPQIANIQGEQGMEDKRPLYVGTLIADERGLKQLERKLYDIRQVEAGRR